MLQTAIFKKKAMEVPPRVIKPKKKSAEKPPQSTAAKIVKR